MLEFRYALSVRHKILFIFINLWWRKHKEYRGILGAFRLNRDKKENYFYRLLISNAILSGRLKVKLGAKECIEKQLSERERKLKKVANLLWNTQSCAAWFLDFVLTKLREQIFEHFFLLRFFCRSKRTEIRIELFLLMKFSEYERCVSD